MCIIIAKDYDKEIGETHIANAIKSNQDGIGFYAFNKDSGIYECAKGLDKNGKIKARVEKLARKKNVRLVFHARIQTHGLTDDQRCHPFPIRGTEWILFHNGMISIKPEYQNWSDTQQFAHETSQFMKDGYSLEEVVEAYHSIFNWSKLVFVHKKTGEWKFWNRKSGTDVNGVWHSNSSALDYAKYENYGDFNKDARWSQYNREWYDDDAYIYADGRWNKPTESTATNKTYSNPIKVYNATTDQWEEEKVESTTCILPDHTSNPAIGYHV